MNLVKALDKSRIATLKIDGKEYFVTHTASYVRENDNDKKINNKDIPDSNEWEAMGIGKILRVL